MAKKAWAERAVGPALMRIVSLVWGLSDWLGLGLAQKGWIWKVLRHHLVTSTHCVRDH